MSFDAETRPLLTKNLATGSDKRSPLRGAGTRGGRRIDGSAALDPETFEFRTGRPRFSAYHPRSMRDAAGWRWWLPRVVLAFLVARLILIGCAATAEAVAAPSRDGPGGSVVRADNRPVLGSFTTWDAVYYLGIARDGYRAGATNGPYPESVFFPLYPALVAAVAPLVGRDLALAGVLVANVASLVGLCGAYLLARRTLASTASLLATTLVALQPGAVAFSMAYSDGLFLALVVGTFLLAVSRSNTAAGRIAVGALGVLCGLTRLQGALLVLPLAIAFYRADGGRLRLSW